MSFVLIFVQLPTINFLQNAVADAYIFGIKLINSPVQKTQKNFFTVKVLFLTGIFCAFKSTRVFKGLFINLYHSSLLKIATHL